MKASELKPGQVGEWAGMLIGKTDDSQYIFELNGMQKVSPDLPIDVDVTLREDIKIVKPSKASQIR